MYDKILKIINERIEVVYRSFKFERENKEIRKRINLINLKRCES